MEHTPNNIMYKASCQAGHCRQTRATTFDKTDFRAVFPRFTPEAREANLALVDLLKRLAGRKKATPAQVALAWLLAQKPWIVPIPGTTKLHCVEENLGSVEVELAPDDLREIEASFAKIAVEGARLPQQFCGTRTAEELRDSMPLWPALRFRARGWGEAFCRSRAWKRAGKEANEDLGSHRDCVWCACLRRAKPSHDYP